MVSGGEAYSPGGEEGPWVPVPLPEFWSIAPLHQELGRLEIPAELAAMLKTAEGES